MLDLFDLSGRIALITGARRGIGFAIAEGLASAGAVSVIADVEQETGEEAARLIRSKGLTAGFIRVDVTRRESVEDMVSRTIGEFGRIDILFNCAGIILRKPIEEATDEEWNATMDVNLRGVFLCSQIAGREMIKRKQGKIINISSNISQVLQPGRGIYAVSKAGVSHLTRVMALEWAPHHINVNAIAPAPTMTDLNRGYFAGASGGHAGEAPLHPPRPDGGSEGLCGDGGSAGVPGLRLHHRPDDLCGRGVHFNLIAKERSIAGTRIGRNGGFAGGSKPEKEE